MCSLSQYTADRYYQYYSNHVYEYMSVPKWSTDRDIILLHYRVSARIRSETELTIDARVMEHINISVRETLIWYYVRAL